MQEPVPFSCDLCGNKQLSAFKDLTPEQVGKMESHKMCSFFKKGQTMMMEGSRPSGVYCIHRGKVKLYRLGSEGKEQIIRFGKGGDLIGYRSILSGEGLSATVEALDDTHACYIPKSLLFEFIEENPKFSLELMKMACHELGEAGKLITNLAQKSVRERLAEVLMLVRNTFGEDEEGYLDVSLTREEIANMVGTATESVIRLMSEFKDDGLIELKARKIKILKPQELLKIGHVFD